MRLQNSVDSLRQPAGQQYEKLHRLLDLSAVTSSWRTEVCLFHEPRDSSVFLPLLKTALYLFSSNQALLALVPRSLL